MSSVMRKFCPVYDARTGKTLWCRLARRDQGVGRFLRIQRIRLSTSAALALLTAMNLAPTLAAARQTGTNDAPDAAPTAEVLLVEGQITNDIGAGNEGVTVTVHRADAAGTKGELIATTSTDQYGDFRVIAAEPIAGDVIVTFSKPNHADLARRLRLGEEAVAPFMGEQLAGNLKIVGVVTHAVSGEPLAGASVVAKSAYREWKADTDDQGRFEITGLSPGPAELTVQAEGYGRESQAIQAVENAGEQTLRLKPERIIHLKLQDDSGQPISGVTVELLDQARDDFRTMISEQDGMVVVRNLHFDARSLSARLTHPEHVSSAGFDREISLPESEAESSHALVMARAGSIAGTVTDAAAGTPLNGARIRIGAVPSTDSPRDWSDYQGRYEIHGVTSGEVVVTVHRSDYAPELKIVTVESGNATKLDVALSPGGVLNGIVHNEEGKPVPGLQIETGKWRGHETLDLRAMTDEEGRFRIHDTPLDEFEISAFVRGSPPATRTVMANGENVVEIIVTAPAKSPQKGETVPPLTVTTLDGKTLDLLQLAGKTILVDFWATWCGPCLAELPMLKAVYKKYGDRDDFIMIGISLDTDEKALRDFLAKSDVGWPQVYGEKSGADGAAQRFGVIGLPAIFLVGPDGRIIATDFHGDAIAKTVADALKDGSAE